MNERTAESATTVEEDGINVEKSFTDDEFPVPAITYELSSDREEPARVRIVDTIPESFPMDRVGFHPEYESDNWTAYKDHRVEFERVLDPGESVRTVFGIRSDDPDIDGFLGAPVIEHVPVGEEIEDVLGTDDTDAVREVLSGDRTTLPGMEEGEGTVDEPPADADPADEPEETEATGASDSDTENEVDGDTPPPRRNDVETESEVTRHDEADPVRDDSGPETDFGSETDSDTPENDPNPGTDAVAGSTIASALADEIRSDEVADDDLELLRSELDVGVPRSVDVRISRLQSSVADIEAYADALAEFIDEEGTARELLESLRSRVDEVESDVTTLDDRVDAADVERAGLATDVEDAEESIIEVEETTARIEQSVSTVEADVDEVAADVDEVAADLTAVDESVETVRDDVRTVESEVTGLDEAIDDLGDDVETLYEELDSTASALAGTDERVEDVESRLGRFDTEFDDVWDDLAEVDGRLTSVEDSLGDDVDDIESELDAIHDHLEELEAFRKRLNEAFGP